MQQQIWKKLLTEWGTAIAIFLLVSIVFFLPVFQGKILIQGDMINYKAASKETLDYNATHDDVALWTDNMFGGMPTYLIHLADTGNFFNVLNKAIGLYLPRPANYLFMASLCFFILLRSFKVRNWLAITGALTFAIGTYMISFIEAGHNTKVHALSVMPLVLAGVNYLFRGRMWLGFSLALLGMCLEIDANHVQITYYMFFILGCWFVAEGFQAAKGQRLPAFMKVTGLMAAVTILALVANTSRLYTTYVYGQDSIRSGSELSQQQNESFSDDGLSKDYVFAWSYGTGESLTLLFPNFAGQASGKSFLEKTDSKSMNYLQQLSARNPQKAQQLQQLTSKYWGALPFTEGPVYLGSIVVFLFLIGAFIAKGRLKWWMIAATILSLLLGWGKHFPVFNDLMYNYFPLYNKFRTVMMALVIACITMPLLGFIALDRLLFNNTDYTPQEKQKGLLTAGIVVGALCLLMLFPGMLFDLTSQQEAQIMQDYGQDPDIVGLIQAVKADRTDMIRNDAFRTIFFVGATFLLLWFYLKGKVKSILAIAGIGLLAVVDLWSINSIYLKKDNYGDSDYYASYFNSQTPVINDNDPHFRVFNTTRRLDQDGFTSWTYNSIGGYHAAKLSRYQDVIDGYLNKGNMPVVNMLNAKYAIINNNGQPAVQRNPGAMGVAWTVDSVVWVKGADAEFAALENLQPGKFAIMDEAFKNMIPEILPVAESNAIQLKSYSPNEISYTFSGSAAQLAVFSEIWYRGNEDWKAYIDGKYVDHFRVNYILRGLMIPEGAKNITFTFEPPSYYAGRKISMAASSLLLLLIAGGIFMAWKKEELTD